LFIICLFLTKSRSRCRYKYKKPISHKYAILHRQNTFLIQIVVTVRDTWLNQRAYT